MRGFLRVVLWVLTAITGVIGGLIALGAITGGSLTDVGGIVMAGCLFAALLLGYVAWSVGSSRPCPRCAKGVRKGVIVCPTCGFDFATLVPTGQRPPD